MTKKKSSTRKRTRTDSSTFAPVNESPVQVKRTPKQRAALQQLFGIHGR